MRSQLLPNGLVHDKTPCPKAKYLGDKGEWVHVQKTDDGKIKGKIIAISILAWGNV